ncbi:hypothetical protein ANCDUO_05445 [Ancylostoma duodenale]|uniref:tRNA (guanine-N(7)-)-methyltransferase non-catalytic subunit n=1 Tax=Ancylostoma duodenale TaxID=51022 RepID=A0A0C2D3Z7_9BILA|nr:hypothetical protein ANCDUO_05445 [Ancylostoma duodenale]
MATVHGVDGRLIICASSKNRFDVKCASSSVPLPKKNSSEENTKDSKNNGIGDSSCQVLCSAVSNCGSVLAVGTSEKTAVIIDSKSLQLRRAFRIPKAPTSITFDKDNTHVVIGDRAGHVCRYTVEASQKSGYVDMNGEDSPYEGEPLSSAISMVLDVAISQDGRYLLAADRDEKIRVSRYPQAFVVQSFCLGQSAYVGSLAVHGDHVFSSGGDSIVYEWDVESGKPVAQSEKLSEDPVRRVCVLPKGDLFNVVAAAGKALHVLDDKLHLIKNIETPSDIMDITTHEGNIVAVSSLLNSLRVLKEQIFETSDTYKLAANAGVFTLDVNDGAVKTLTVPSELAEALSSAKDPISNYFKNVTHQNMVDYYKRKAEKIENVKENQGRKRKAKEQRRKAAKRLAAEAEVAC